MVAWTLLTVVMPAAAMQPHSTGDEFEGWLAPRGRGPVLEYEGS